jgi:hypothetical protein
MSAGGAGVTGAMRTKKYLLVQRKKSKHGSDCQKKKMNCSNVSKVRIRIVFFLTRYRRYGTDGWRKYANSETITPSTPMQHGWIGVGRLRATYVAN